MSKKEYPKVEPQKYYRGYMKKTDIADFIPKEFVDIERPLNEKEEKVGRYDTDDSYLHWLADYLYNTEIPLPESQRLYLEQNRTSGIRKDKFENLLWQMAYQDFHSHALDNFCEVMDYDGEDKFECLNEMQLECYEDEISQVDGYDENFPPLKEHYLFTREEFERHKYEFEQETKIPIEEMMNDMPYRAIMAHFLKNIPDHEERFRYLKFYEDKCEEEAWDWYE